MTFSPFLGIGRLEWGGVRLLGHINWRASVLPPKLTLKLSEQEEVHLGEESNLQRFIFNDSVDSFDLLGLKLCQCCFKGSVGRLFIDTSCKGVKGVWVIDEGSGSATGGISGSWISADGFVLDGTTYKIDGSTCVKLTCNGSDVTVDTCVNLIAGRVLGKKPAYPVPAGAFGGPPKDPAVGSSPPPVK